MTQNTSLTRICIACGIQKPLSAFLHLSGTKGTTYGNICSTCRNLNIQQEAKQPDNDEEEGSSSSGLRIDAKAKVQAAQDKKEVLKKTKELAQRENKKRDKMAVDKIQNIKKTEQAEKKHRHYLDAKKKSGFLGFQGKTPSEPTNQRSQEKQAAVTQEQQTEAAKTARSQTEINLAQPGTAAQLSQVKYQASSVFKEFKAWLGGAAAVNLTEQKAKKTKEEKNTLVEEAKKNWGPASRKK